jgi:signal transduction histidine kinase
VTPTPDDFRNLNQCVDLATATAIDTYSREARATERQDQAERLGSLAHEIRNSLSSASMAFDVLKRGTVGPSGRTGAIIERAHERIRNLVEDALHEARRAGTAATDREGLDVRTELLDVSAAAFPERAIQIVVEVVPGITLQADRRLLGSAIQNLLQNAIKFTRDGETITLRAVALPDGTVRIEIEDRCGGLRPGAAEKIFRPFVQARGRDAPLRGVGLGLTIARRAVEAHGGTIGVRDLPGVGCVFTIEMPKPVAPQETRREAA